MKFIALILFLALIAGMLFVHLFGFWVFAAIVGGGLILLIVCFVLVVSSLPDEKNVDTPD